MNRGTLYTCIFFAGATSFPAGFVRAGNVTVTIDNDIQHQTMAGFGATHQSLVYEVEGEMIDVLGPTLRAQALDAIYNQVRINIGNYVGTGGLESPGGFDLRQNDNSDPFSINWAGFNFNGADAMKESVLDLAPSALPDFYLESKINLRWLSEWLSPIREANYDLYLDECAEQVLAGQIYWRDTYAIIPRLSMVFNEPLNGNRELWPGSPQEIVDIIKRTGARLRDQGFSDILFVVPGDERDYTSLDIATTILADSDARQYVGVIAYHPYPFSSTYASIPSILATSGTGNPDAARVAVRNQLRDLGQQHGLPVWMTEVSNGGVDPRSFDDLRGRSIHIHDELIYANASAYFGMNSMWDLESQISHFGNSNLYGSSSEGTIVLIDQSHQDVVITGMGYAIGHYARWIDPGAVRIEASSSDPLVQVTAFRDDQQGRLVLVAINNDSASKAVNVSVSGLSLKGALTGEHSTAVAAWQPNLPLEPASPQTFTISLPAESVTTVSGAFAALTAIPTTTGWGIIVMALLLVAAGTMVLRSAFDPRTSEEHR